MQWRESGCCVVAVVVLLHSTSSGTAPWSAAATPPGLPSTATRVEMSIRAETGTVCRVHSSSYQLNVVDNLLVSSCWPGPGHMMHRHCHNTTHHTTLSYAMLLLLCLCCCCRPQPGVNMEKLRLGVGLLLLSSLQTISRHQQLHVIKSRS